MNSSELKNIIGKIVGLRLDRIGRACEMLTFDFGNYSVHAQCLTRIIRNSDILLTTLDYQSWDGEDDKNNDEWYSLDKFGPVIENGAVISVEINRMCDLTVVLDNGVTVQFIIGNGYPHYGGEQEQYRFFETGPDGETREQAKQRKHYVVYNKSIKTE